MSTYASTHDPPSANAIGSQPSRKPHKKSSFLSLRREQRSPTSPDPSPGSGRSHAQGDKSTSPSAFHAFQDVSRPIISRPTELGSRSHNRRPSKTTSLRHDSGYSRGAREREREREADYELGLQAQAGKEKDIELGFVDFPSVDQHSSRSRGSESSTKARSRARSGPSSKRSFPGHASGDLYSYPIRDSNSSSLSQFTDIPQTPVDDSYSYFRDPVFGSQVVVAAPVAGVETMDALVDGMNHFGGDDHFMGMGGMSGRHKFSTKSGFHPLYHPPLPTPPPGITLGGALPRKASAKSRESDADEEEDTTRTRPPPRPKKSPRPPPVRSDTIRPDTADTIKSAPSPHTSPAEPLEKRPQTSPQRTVAPSISEIIRAHAPPEQQVRSRKSSYATSYGHGSQQTHGKCLEPEPVAEVKAAEEEGDLISRSSVDTLAEEIQRTIQAEKRASVANRTIHKAKSFQYTHAAPESSRPASSPRTDGRRESSIFSYSTTISEQPPLPPLDAMGLTKVPVNSPSQTIAQYLRSTRLTTLLRLTRSPHASRGNPLTVSLSDLGSPTGFPLVVFLGLGCVRHIMGLYDEMAECMGIRLITIDRWGLGRTEVPKNKSARGIPEWAGLVEEVLDHLNIDQCSVMAHSAGAPYAMAFANRFPERIRGEVCLLAPWVAGGEGGGYKWLKYVPNGLLKTAQAAEWKLQAWMLGKPPTIAFEGIGFDVKTAPGTPSANSSSSAIDTPRSPPNSASTITPSLAALQEQESRPSMSSVAFSEYDDLRDFDGCFESRSTIGRASSSSQRKRVISECKTGSMSQSTARKPSRGFLGRFKSNASNQSTPAPTPEKASGPAKTLKALRSMGSLKGRSRPGTGSKMSDPPVPTPPWIPSPSTDGTEIGLGLEQFDWSNTSLQSSRPPSPVQRHKELPPLDLSRNLRSPTPSTRAGGRRSISFTAGSPSSPPLIQSPQTTGSRTPSNAQSFQAALGNALIAASHSESAKGTHGDLLQILNHDRQPWGFSYAAYPHNVRIWYGDRDEKIAENAVRWMENAMGPDKCQVKVIKGADHSLMFKSSVVIEVLEHIAEYWRDWN
ncbi:alpha/beta-hydrolase [Trametes sanguinea]|nr:alpha/beta-hydrolase [Trametes sanguinea]